MSDRISAGQPPIAAATDPRAAPGIEPAATAGIEPAAAPRVSGFLARGRIRRRARYLRQLRELQLRDIGGFMLELHRFGRSRPDLVTEKVLDAARTDAEMRSLEQSLSGAGMREPGEVRLAGIGGTCVGCGAVHGSEDRYCASCGEPLSDRVSKL